MGLCYMAMTKQELVSCKKLPEKTAWFSCHFSARGTGLSHLPEQLPTGSLLILDDWIPPRGHDRQQVCAQLLHCIQAQNLSGILLDFQRPDDPQTLEMAQHLSRQLPCPVIVSLPYAEAADGPVLLPPPPMYKLPQDYLAPWKGREIWLEAATGSQRLTLTEKGCQVGDPEPLTDLSLPFEDEALFCRYGISLQEKQAVFTLSRTPELLKKLLDQLQLPAVGLYQELHSL